MEWRGRRDVSEQNWRGTFAITFWLACLTVLVVGGTTLEEL